MSNDRIEGQPHFVLDPEVGRRPFEAGARSLDGVEEVVDRRIRFRSDDRSQIDPDGSEADPPADRVIRQGLVRAHR